MITQRLGALRSNIKLVAFGSTQHAHTQHAETFARELAALNPRIDVETYTLEKDPDEAKAYGIDKVPALIIETLEGRQARFFGLPSGQEFNVFLSELVDFANGNIGLPHEIVQKAKAISTPMHLQVFVSDTCPYCPGMVRLTHGMAMANSQIRADMVRIEQFRALADKFNVMSVPHTVVNGKSSVVGSFPSDIFVKKLKEMENVSSS